LNPRPHEAQLEDQKLKKSLRRSSRRRKNRKTNKWQVKRQTKEKLKLKTPPEINSPQYSQCKLSPLGRIYHVSSLNDPVSIRVLSILCTFSPRLIINSSNLNREKHEIKIMVLHKLYKQVFKQLYKIIVPRLAKIRVNPHKETIKR
jgi:hypothetical protein